MSPKTLSELLQTSSQLHHHLCPKQVLGVRMGLLAGKILDLELPQIGKRLLTIMETDGCSSDGIAVATNCWVGKRTMRIEDYGKVAATCVDTLTGKAVRILPAATARSLAQKYAPEAHNPWEVFLWGYQRMPDEELLAVTPVVLNIPVEKILSHPEHIATCQQCGEEIINERELHVGERILCRACAGFAYYILV
jgi:formylmethanofuran dehydrogenase subunit E